MSETTLITEEGRLARLSPTVFFFYIFYFFFHLWFSLSQLSSSVPRILWYRGPHGSIPPASPFNEVLQHSSQKPPVDPEHGGNTMTRPFLPNVEFLCRLSLCQSSLFDTLRPSQSYPTASGSSFRIFLSSPSYLTDVRPHWSWRFILSASFFLSFLRATLNNSYNSRFTLGPTSCRWMDDTIRNRAMITITTADKRK